MFEIKKQVDLKDFCTFHIGGKAKFLFVAEDTASLIKVCCYAKSHNIKYKIIGLGANLLFDDLGFDGLIIVNRTNSVFFELRDPSTPLRMTTKGGSTPLTPLRMTTKDDTFCHVERSVTKPKHPLNEVTRNLRGSFDSAQDYNEGRLHTVDSAQDDNEERLHTTDSAQDDITLPTCHSEQTKCVEESHKISDNYFVYVDSGVNVTNLIMKCCMRSLCGFEKLAGIPSTVGGAVVNSLGAFETNFSDYVEYVECYHKNNLTKKLRLTREECKFGYRTSLFKSGDYIITKVKLKLHEDNQTLIRKRITEAIEKKKSTQPLDEYSAGSVFKRTNIIPAKVIDELGLKGTKIGGAEISTKHAGFIINSQSATSEDVKTLISLIQEKVKSAINEDLTPEIEFVEY